MKNGLYEKTLDYKSQRKLENKEYKEVRDIDTSEMPRVISTTYQKIILEALLNMDKVDEKLKFIENLNQTIGIEGFCLEDKNFK